MKRLLAGLIVSLAALGAHGCNQTEPGAGSNTNWLRPCSTDDDCDRGLSCLCGVCSAPCESECRDLPSAVCAAAGSARARTQCAEAGDANEAPGLCLPACDQQLDCAPGQFCSEGGCLQLAAADASATGCVAGASLELTSEATQLQARSGTLYSDALYLPVSYEERPEDWTEPAPPVAITARVTDAQGEPVRGCAVRWLTGDGSGAAFAATSETNETGEIAAYWVAGAEREQTLSAVLVDARGEVASQRVSGLAYANDEGPQADDAAARAEAARPATLRLGFDLPDTSTRLRVVLSAATFPHHAFYAAVSIDGFFAGLQNTSDLDAPADDVPDAERVLIASVWNLPEGDAQQLFGVPDLDCAPHGQGLGGIRCLLPSAWQLGPDYVLELERTSVAEGDSGPGYAALGYSTEPCASSAGCTDYTLFFGPANEPDSLTRVVAYRYQSGRVASSFGSFVQPYSELPQQNSCLLTPVYDARFLPLVETANGFERVRGGTFGADYESWHNEVCANYAASVEADGYRLVTGGPLLWQRPQLPDEPARSLELP